MIANKKINANASAIDYSQSSSDSKKYLKRLEQENSLKRKRAIRKQYLRNLILNHGRIDVLMTEILGYSIMDFHYLLWYHRKNHAYLIEKQKWHLALAPRGAGKSTILTVASVILDILQNPNIRILIASKTDENAVAFLSEIKAKLQLPELVEIFGLQKGELWNEGVIKVAQRTSTDKEPTVKTVGVNGALASGHFDKIYADDLVDEENSKTEAQREKLFTWFYKILDPTLEPDGAMSVVGTRYHPEDLYGKLIATVFEKKNKAGKIIRQNYIRLPALMRKPKHLCVGLTKTWEKYTSIWPEKFSVKFLLKKRATQGTIIFNSQMQNDVEAMKGKIFKFDWFQFYEKSDINIKELFIVQGVDLAIKQHETADKFAHCTIGIHPQTRNIYILEYYNKVTHYKIQKQVIKAQFKKYDPVRVAIEANGYQRSLLQDMRLDPKLSNIRAVPLFTDKDKTLRAWKLSAYFERGQVFMLQEMHEMQQTLLQMPDGRYKDLFDALDFAVEIAFNHKAQRVRESEPGLI